MVVTYIEAAMQTPQPVVQTQAPEGLIGTRRYVALDAYRGFIMLLLASEGFGFAFLKQDPTWSRVAGWFDHVPWEGAVFWDMIQPAFMFMVGVAMPFALAKRTDAGATWADNFRHVLARSVRLIIMSQILIWVSAGRIRPQLIMSCHRSRSLISSVS
jgi:heparan-alpha-glucosaminide N-acetyltransferase